MTFNSGFGEWGLGHLVRHLEHSTLRFGGLIPTGISSECSEVSRIIKKTTPNLIQESCPKKTTRGPCDVLHLARHLGCLIIGHERVWRVGFRFWDLASGVRGFGSRVSGSGLWVWGLGFVFVGFGLGFGVGVLGFGVWGLRFEVWGLGFGVEGVGFRFLSKGLVFRVWGSGFRV